MKYLVSIFQVTLLLLTFISAGQDLIAFPRADNSSDRIEFTDQIKPPSEGLVVLAEQMPIGSNYGASNKIYNSSATGAGILSKSEFFAEQIAIAQIAGVPRDIRNQLSRQLFPYHFFW